MGPQTLSVCLPALLAMSLSVPLALVLGSVVVPLFSLGLVSALGDECDLIPHLIGPPRSLMSPADSLL